MNDLNSGNTPVSVAEVKVQYKGHMDDSHPSCFQCHRKRGRGPSRLRGLTSPDPWQSISRLPVHIDEHLIPRGDNAASLITYIGIRVRSIVSIDIDDWREVDRELKDQIWTNVLEHFDVPNTPEVKKMVKKRAGERWRNFKTNLTKDYIRGRKIGLHPKDEYPELTDEAWEVFKKKREDPKFKELSKVNQERRAKNVHPHRLSRMGYKGLEETMMQKQMVVTREDVTSDPTVQQQPLQPPPRHAKWKAARVKDGKYLTPESAEMATRIDAIEEQSSQGLFTPSGRDDILATAIGKQDHPGRVVGVGAGVGLKKYFGVLPRKSSSSSSKVSKEQLNQQLKEVESRLKKHYDDQLQLLREELTQQPQQLVVDNFDTEKGSTNVPVTVEPDNGNTTKKRKSSPILPV